MLSVKSHNPNEKDDQEVVVNVLKPLNPYDSIVTEDNII